MVVVCLSCLPSVPKSSAMKSKQRNVSKSNFFFISPTRDLLYQNPILEIAKKNPKKCPYFLHFLLFRGLYLHILEGLFWHVEFFPLIQTLFYLQKSNSGNSQKNLKKCHNFWVFYFFLGFIYIYLSVYSDTMIFFPYVRTQTLVFFLIQKWHKFFIF